MFTQIITDEEVVEIAKIYAEDETATFRSLAEIFGYSKSTIHRIFKEILKGLDEELYKAVKKKISLNIKMRSIRGAKATQAKYARLKSK